MVGDRGGPTGRDAVTVLFVAANPAATSRLALDEEAHRIERELRMAKYRDAFRFRTLWAARPVDLLRGLNDEQPAVIHFSGHGKHGEGLVLADDDGETVTVPGASLRRLLAALPTAIRLVVLNACFSSDHGAEVANVVGCAIGMNAAIGDIAARRFSEALYSAMGSGLSVRSAFEQAVAMSALHADRRIGRDVEPASEPPPEEPSAQVPVLHHRRDVDPKTIVLVARGQVVGEAADSETGPSVSATMNAGGGAARRGKSMAGDRGVQIGRDAVGNVITTGDGNLIEADITATKREEHADPAAVDLVRELAVIRTLLLSVESEHAKKIGRALDDADEEASKKGEGSKDELGKALDRALSYAKSASAFAVTAAKLGPHLKNVVAWLGDKWTALLTHLA